MVDALSSRLLSNGSAPYRPTGAEDSQDASGGRHAVNSQVEPDRESRAFALHATVISLSPAALEQMGKLHDGKNAEARERFDNDMEITRLNFAIRDQQNATTILPELKERYETLLKTKPIAAVELTGKDKDAAFALLDRLGLRPKGDNFLFVHDDVMYTFKSDGTVTTNDPDVPTTEEFRQQLLSSMRGRISGLTKQATLDVDATVQRRDRLLERQAELAAT